jgi:hypothetical protein
MTTAMLTVPRHASRLFGLVLPMLAVLSDTASANVPRRVEPGASAARPAASRPAPTRPTAVRARPAVTPVAAAVAAPVFSNEPWDACARAIAAAEGASGLPAGLLGAIARVETGRRTPGGTVQPWPWSYNAAGEGRYASSRAEAVAEVQALQARGVRSVDIGCMQINLLHHPDAFPSVDAGFDPATNIAYAVRFLRSLHAQTGDWAQATARYHSATPERGLIYHQRVMAAMTGQGFQPGPAPGVIPLPGPAMAGLCASGRGAVLLLGAQAPSLRPVVAVPEVQLQLRGRRAPVPNRPRIMCLRTSSRTSPG